MIRLIQFSSFLPDLPADEREGLVQVEPFSYSGWTWTGLKLLGTLTRLPKEEQLGLSIARFFFECATAIRKAIEGRILDY